jgi:hypothetical protein
VDLPDAYIADALAAIGSQPNRPRQSILRRAVSTAYYALFIELSDDAASAMAPASPTKLKAVVRRKLKHSTMVGVCKAWKARNSPWGHLIVAGPPAQLATVAGDFVALQEERHEADYEPTLRLSKAGAMASVLRARDAIQTWRALKAAYPDAASVFLVSLLHDRPKA